MTLNLIPESPSNPRSSAQAEVPPTEGMEFDTDLPPLDIGTNLSLPDWVSSNSKQDVILVLDSSASMRSKLGELDQSVTALWRVLADEENKNGFRLSIIRFSDDAELVLDGIFVQQVQLERSQVIGGTNFDRAVEKAFEVVNNLVQRPNPEGWMWLRPQVLFLSDGHSHASPDNIDRLQEVADVWSVAFGAGANFAELSKIASDGQAHVVGTNGGELRKFLAQVGETLSAGRLNAR